MEKINWLLCFVNALFTICSRHHYLLIDRRITSWPNHEFIVYSAVCQHQTIFYWPTAKYKAKLLKIPRSLSFRLGLFSVFPSPQPPSLEDEILRHLGPWERDQVKSTRAASQDTNGTNMTNRLVVNAGTGLLHNLAGGMLMLLLRALFSLFSQMHLCNVKSRHHMGQEILQTAEAALTFRSFDHFSKVWWHLI